MPVKKRTSTLAQSFRAAANGLKIAIVDERNMRIHLSVALYVIIFGFIGQIDLEQWAIVFICFSAVLAAELINSAVERLCDLVEPEFNRDIGIIKDLSSGAVLVAAICSAVAGLIIFLSPDILRNVISLLLTFPWVAVCIAVSFVPVMFFILPKR